MNGANGSAVNCTRTCVKSFVAGASELLCGRNAIPSKLKLVAALSMAESVRIAPVTVFDQVMVMTIEVRFVRCNTNCKVYGVRLAKPPKLLVLRSSLASVVQSPVAPSRELSLMFVRLRMSMGWSSANVW
jgi:hypothetical protein